MEKLGGGESLPLNFSPKCKWPDILAAWIWKQDPCIFCQQEAYLTKKDVHSLLVKGMKKILHSNGNKEGTGVAILIADK